MLQNKRRTTGEVQALTIILIIKQTKNQIQKFSSCLHTYKNEILCLRCFKKAIDTYLRFKIRITADIFFLLSSVFSYCKMLQKIVFDNQNILGTFQR